MNLSVAKAEVKFALVVVQHVVAHHANPRLEAVLNELIFQRLRVFLAVDQEVPVLFL